VWTFARLSRNSTREQEIMSYGAKPEPDHSKEKVVVAYAAGNGEEAMVIRGLLASNGIYTPGFESTDPFPLSEPLEGNPEIEIRVLDSQVKKAQQIIEEYVRDNDASSSSDSSNE
jgi:hypothetical protein